MDRQLLKGHSDLMVLAALSIKAMHGYALSEYLREHTDETFEFGSGMLYPLLHKLEKEKLIVGTWDHIDGANRRVYRLTKQGKKALERRRREWIAFSRLISKVITV